LLKKIGWSAAAKQVKGLTQGSVLLGKQETGQREKRKV